MRYLIVSTDQVYAHHVAVQLRSAGRVADVHKDGLLPPPVLRRYLEDYGVDALVLDVSDTGRLAGAGVVRGWRRACGQTLTMMAIHRRDYRLDVPALLAAGADICHDRDEDARIIVARLEAVVRRCQGFSSATLCVPPFSLETDSGTLRAGNERVMLTRMETRVLEVLMRQRGRLVRRNAILLRLRQELPAEGSVHSLDVIIGRLRQKLRSCQPQAGEVIHTRRNMGFMFEVSAAEADVQPVKGRATG
ncbi:hypothetical protein BL250_15490 [Erwinia sp. OLTSP20]|uniref:response regulator transcription factor n=1 Tax=unclassified Erwinia TaxID=2622719 RepID=UPI000C17D67F|nr:MULTISPECIES: response regulator transcription factor [unclassified Erwinia]PIJ48611.1 hypothetical protein BV501_16510 [Erwinia sp. OAMSP11]PIJ68965.1 hypothetical protein BK416_15750 [Erwinia sp. OLSSP12]PIJ78821.1 hypothetical protein BLD47_16505 [Erwinia sp. OLCASP19]PIJ79929.1 hypothetical protein BLD46_16400 [Erwinia sp. OLMTSP26]PIJ82047.1 hypothetical protein BLD49_15915 [Erwinia sp. OLMDSP33]